MCSAEEVHLKKADMKIKLWADEARDLLLTLPMKLQTETIPLAAACSRVLASDITTQLAMPPFDRSPYDGYALRSQDASGASEENPVVLHITEEIPAGHVPAVLVTKGTAAKILTGAPMPTGADCVVPFEVTEFDEKMVRLFRPVPAGSNVIPAGEELPKGRNLLEKGTLLTPPMLGMLASQGYDTCEVFERPGAALITTGSELQAPDEPLVPGKIYNSNGFALQGYLTAFGFRCEGFLAVPDNVEAISGAIQDALQTADVVVTTGGASVGDYDFATAAAQRLGADILFWKTRIKPGSCILAAQKDEKLILCLSGNPGAAVTGLLRVALPYLRKRCGRKDLFPEEIVLPLKYPLKKESKVPRLLRGRLEIQNGQAWFVETNGQGNGMLSAFCGMDLLGEVPANSPPLPAGTPIRAYRLID